VELHAGQSSPSYLFESLVTIQRSAERNCSSHVYSTQLFHSDKLAPSLPDSLLLLSLSLSLSHALTTMYTRFPSSPPSLITLRHRLPTPPVSLSYACTVGFVNYLRGDGETLSCPVFGLEALAWSQMADHCVKHMKNRQALHMPHVHYELQVIYKL